MHPDVNPALRSTDDAVQLNEAYAVLQLVSPVYADIIASDVLTLSISLSSSAVKANGRS